MRYYLLCLFVVLSLGVSAQIVNIESRRLKSDTTGWLGSFGIAVQASKNKVQVLNLSTNAQLEYKAPKSLYLFLVNYDLLKGASQTLQNNLFFHLRYNYKVTSVLRWEAFSQMQHNNLSGIKSRWLLGTGPRFKISGTPKLALYAASLMMYEDEQEIGEPPIHHKDLRSSNYASASWRPAERAELVSTIFYQPLFRNFSDYRILHELQLNFNFTSNFSFNTTWSLLYDSSPPQQVPAAIYTLKNGIQYKF